MTSRRLIAVVFDDIALANEGCVAIGESGETFGSAKLCPRESGLGPPSHAIACWVIDDGTLAELVKAFDARGVRYEIRDDPRGSMLVGSADLAYRAVSEIGLPQTVSEDALATLPAEDMETLVAKAEDEESREWIKEYTSEREDSPQILAAVEAKAAEMEKAE